MSETQQTLTKLSGYKKRTSSLLFQLENIIDWTEKKLLEHYENLEAGYHINNKIGDICFKNNKIYYGPIHLNSIALKKLTLQQFKLILKSIPNLIKELEKCKN